MRKTLRRLFRRALNTSIWLAFIVVAICWAMSLGFNDVLRVPLAGATYSFYTFHGGMSLMRHVVDEPEHSVEWHHYQYGAPAGGNTTFVALPHDWSLGGFLFEHKQYLHTMGSWGGKYLQPITLNDPRYASDAHLADYRTLSIPYWFPLLLLSIPMLIQIKRRFLDPRKQRKRANLGLCPHCGYDLRASTDSCPECGARIVIVRSPETVERGCS